MFCTKCGNKINENEAFCSSCGELFDSEGAEDVSPTNAAIDPNPFASTVSPVLNDADVPERKRSSFIVQNGLGTLVAFHWFIVGFVFSWRARKGEKAGNRQEANENAYIAKVLFWVGLSALFLNVFCVCQRIFFKYLGI